MRPFTGNGSATGACNAPLRFGAITVSDIQSVNRRACACARGALYAPFSRHSSAKGSKRARVARHCSAKGNKRARVPRHCSAERGQTLRPLFRLSAGRSYFQAKKSGISFDTASKMAAGPVLPSEVTIPGLSLWSSCDISHTSIRVDVTYTNKFSLSVWKLRKLEVFFTLLALRSREPQVSADAR